MQFNINKMKGILLGTALLSAVWFSSCAIQKAANLANCQFRLNKIHSIDVAGVQLNPNGATNISFQDGLKLASAYASKSLPSNLNALLDISNPNNTEAKMVKFDWQIKLKDELVTSGEVNQVVQVPAKGESSTSLSTGFDLYQVLEGKSVGQLKEMITNALDEEGAPKDLQIFLKPYVKVAGLNIPYPGYIEVSKYYKSK